MKIFLIACYSLLPVLFYPSISSSQTVLEADATGNAYTVINNVLAPGATAIETPDQTSGGSAVGSHPSFGKHIQMVYDSELNKYVFQFLIHVNSVLDNDVSTGNNDRQRVEMKTYAASPANLIGTMGENITYKWQFCLPIGFQPSNNFTHIHQVKAVGGDESSPIFTITPRYSASGNTLQLIYVKDSANSNFYCATAPLSNFLGVWVEATEQLTVGANGTYSMSIKRVSDGVVLLSYNNNNIQTIRPSNSFIRPKWGIYRSISTSSLLRDDSLRIASVSITENQPLPVTIKSFTGNQSDDKNILLNWQVAAEVNLTKYIIERSNNRVNFNVLAAVTATQLNTYQYLDVNSQVGINYYRLKLVNKDGSFSYSATVTVLVTTNQLLLHLSPNPVLDVLQITFKKATNEQASINIINSIGQVVKAIKITDANQGNISVSVKELTVGLYTVQLLNNDKQIVSQKMIKQ